MSFRCAEQAGKVLSECRCLVICHTKQELNMAKITVEDCLKRIDNRFGLIHLAAKRVRQLRKGAEPLVVCKNKDVVVALREIASGKVFKVDNENEDLAANKGNEIPEALPEETQEISPDEQENAQKEN